MQRRFEARAGNNFQLLIDGDACGSALLGAIAEAEHYVLVEHYLIESGGFASVLIDALRSAADRGVIIYALFDDFGSKSLAAADRNLLVHANINLCWYNPIRIKNWLRNFHRDHRKLVLVDQKVAFVGGFCITDYFWSGTSTETPAGSTAVVGRRRPWLDVAVKIEGPILVDWQELFARVWFRATMRSLVLPKLSSASVGDRVGTVAWANGHIHQGIQREFLARARKSRTRIYIATPYFAPSWRIRRALIKAAKRGVQVCLLLSGPENDHPGVRFAAWRYYKKLLRHGVRIFEYQPRFVHAKIILCDDWVSIGSCNLDHWNQRWNLEANQEVQNEDFANDVHAFFLDSFQECEEQDLRNWIKPYWRRRLLAYFWGRVDSWLMRL